MYRVQKRNGSFTDFDIRKITGAITKAFEACNQPFDENIIEMLALKVTADFTPKVKDNVIAVEDIQDSVESILAQAGYMDVAKAYIRYRDQHAKVRKADENMLNYKKVVDQYLKVDDWRVKENSTVSYSIGGLILSNSGAVTANYWLNEIYDKEVSDAHKNADLHLHDLSMLAPYCFTGDTRIKTVYSKNYSFKELVDNKVQSIRVFAFDGNRVVHADAINPRVTRKVTQLVRITLNNQQVIEATLDHPFMVRTGEYVHAKDLQVGTLLMPLDASYNATVEKVEPIMLDTPIEVYDITVPGYENFALDAGVFVHNCAGWSLKQLIERGIGGVPGKITSAPASHLSTLCNQMVNFLGIMQNEWAG